MSGTIRHYLALLHRASLLEIRARFYPADTGAEYLRAAANIRRRAARLVAV